MRRAARKVRHLSLRALELLFATLGLRLVRKVEVPCALHIKVD